MTHSFTTALAARRRFRPSSTAFTRRWKATPRSRASGACIRPTSPNLKDKLVAFLSGFAGGPPVYPPGYGPPFMRARHLHVPIGTQERDMWLKCASAAIDAAVADPEARNEFGAKLAAFLTTCATSRPVRIKATPLPDPDEALGARGTGSLDPCPVGAARARRPERAIEAKEISAKLASNAARAIADPRRPRRRGPNVGLPAAPSCPIVWRQASDVRRRIDVRRTPLTRRGALVALAGLGAGALADCNAPQTTAVRPRAP